MKTNKLFINCIAVAVLSIVLLTTITSYYRFGVCSSGSVFSNQASETPIYIGPYEITPVEYTYMYYKIIYDQYPHLLGRSFESIEDFLKNQPAIKNESITDTIKDQTTYELKKLLCFYQYCLDNNISLDESELSTEFKNHNVLAQMYNISYDSMLSFFGPEMTESSVNRINLWCLARDKVSSLVKDKIIHSNDIENYYLTHKNDFDVFNIDYMCVPVQNLSNKDETVSELTQIYAKTHSRKDFISQTTQFKANNAELNITIHSGEELLLQGSELKDNLSSDIVNWIVSPERSADNIALFDGNNYITLIYYNYRTVDQTPTFNISEIQMESTIKNNSYLFSEDTLVNTCSDINKNISSVSFFDALMYIATNYSSSFSLTAVENKTIAISNTNPQLEGWLLPDNIGKTKCFLLDDNILSVVFINGEGLPSYQEKILEVLIKNKIKDITSTYWSMFSNTHNF